MSTYLRTLEVFGMQAKAIVQELDETFPPTNPNPEMTMEQIMYRSGQRSVVEWIKRRWREDSHGIQQPKFKYNRSGMITNRVGKKPYRN